MQAMLASLSQIQGVLGSAVFSAAGECILHQMPAPYEPPLLNRLFSDLRTVLDAFRYMDDAGATDAFVCRFDKGNLVLRPMGANSVLLITSPDVNMAMVNVGLKVASLKMERSAEAAHASLPPPPLTPSIAPPSSQFAPAPTSAASSSRVTLSSNPPQAPSVPPITVSSAVEGASIPPDAVGARIADDLVRLLAAEVGPFAKVLFKQELKRIGSTVQTLTRPQLDDLIGLLAPKVPEPAARVQFIAAARRLVAKA